MKKIALTIALFAGAMNMMAEINPDFGAPTNFQAYHVDEQVQMWFNAPTEGGVVWASDFSYENGLGDLRQIGDGDGWSNAGNGGEISTSSFAGAVFTNHASSLATPTVTLAADTNYELTFRSAGSRKSENQQLSVVLYRDGNAVKTLKEAYELSASLTYENQKVSFSVTEGGDYEVRFVFTESTKNCGASLMSIVISAPIPAERGALKGYNLYCNGAVVKTYGKEEATDNQLYKELWYAAAFDYSTLYTFALQAVYEGGESPLSNEASFTTPEDPLVGIDCIVVAGTTTSYDLSGRRAYSNGITISGRRKMIK